MFPYGSVSKPIVPLFCSHQNSWVKMDVHPIKNGIFIGIDPYPYVSPIPFTTAVAKKPEVPLPYDIDSRSLGARGLSHGHF